MRRPLVRSVALAASVALALGSLVALGGAAGAAATTTRVALNVHPHDQLGALGAPVYTPSNATIAVGGSTHQVDVTVTTSGPSPSVLHLSFAAPGAGALAAGTYSGGRAISAADPSRPGLDVYSGSTPCAISAGTFVIRHVAFDAGVVSALDLSFVRECGGRSNAATSGDVVIGEAVPAFEGTVASLMFADGVVGSTGAPPSPDVAQKVTVTNHAGSAATPTWSLTGETSYFTLGGLTSCATAAESACSAYVTFTQPIGSVVGSHAATLELKVAGSVVWSAPVSARVTDPSTWIVASEPHAVGAGLAREMHAGDDFDLGVHGDPGELVVHADDVATHPVAYDLRIAAPSGDTLHAGGTYDALPFATRGAAAGAELDATDGDCVTASTHVVISELTFGADGEVTRLVMTYDHVCVDGVGVAHAVGSIAWRTPSAPDAPPALPAHQAPGLSVTAAGGLGTVTVAYVATGTDLLAPVVRAAFGTTPPATATDGFPVPVTGAGVATRSGLTVGAAVSVRVFVQDANGYSATAAAVLHGNASKVAVGDASLTYGQATTITGTVLGDGTAPVPGATVLVQTRRHGTSAWHTSATRTTGAAGTARLTGFRPSVTTDVRVVTSRPATHVSAVSPTRTLVVRPVVSLTADHTSVRKSKTVTFRGSVRQPSGVRGSVVLQRWSGGKWRTVATHTLSASRTYAFTVKQKAKGTFKFRAYRPAAGGRASAVSPVRVVKVR